VAISTAWNPTLRAAKDEAVLAVRLYNDPAEVRAFEGFVMHMHVAWLYLLHARFLRDDIDSRYPDRDRPGKFVRVDGEFKRWELARCILERWPNEQEAVRKNLEFFVGLRNRIEHRHSRSDVTLALAVGGHAQALLLNFEDETTATFGVEHTLADRLRVPLFIGTFTTDGDQTLKALRDKLPPGLRRFIADFHAGLPEEVTKSPHFDLRLRVVLESVGSGSDALAIQFTRWDDMSVDEKAAAELLGRRGQAIVREQTRSVVGHGLHRPGEVERRVAAAIPFVFNSYHFLRSWQIKGIRPPNGDAHPERTDQRYCVYDELANQYGYTEAWVKWLIKHCSTADGFTSTTGRPAKVS